MFGLDEQVAALGHGEAFLVLAALAVVLGLRHATDPDHLTAVSTLLASGEERGPRLAGLLGVSWGLGHATSLFAFGLPVVLAGRYLPEGFRQGSEIAVGALIAALALRLLARWRRGQLVGRQTGEQLRAGKRAERAPRRGSRSPLQAYGIGLVHGVGGSAGIGVLLLAAIPDRLEAVAALLLFAFSTAISMSLASTGFGYALTRGPAAGRFAAAAPLLGALSLTFGVCYGLGAAGALPALS
jgi:hypothetical protein